MAHIATAPAPGLTLPLLPRCAAEKATSGQRALRHWLNRRAASAWTNWRSLVEFSRENERLADEHKKRLYAYLQTVRYRRMLRAVQLMRGPEGSPRMEGGAGC